MRDRYSNENRLESIKHRGCSLPPPPKDSGELSGQDWCWNTHQCFTTLSPLHNTPTGESSSCWPLCLGQKKEKEGTGRGFYSPWLLWQSWCIALATMEFPTAPRPPWWIIAPDKVSGWEREGKGRQCLTSQMAGVVCKWCTCVITATDRFNTERNAHRACLKFLYANSRGLPSIWSA